MDRPAEESVEGTLVLYYQHTVADKLPDFRHHAEISLISSTHACMTNSHTCVDTLHLSGTVGIIRDSVNGLRRLEGVDRVAFVAAPPAATDAVEIALSAPILPRNTVTCGGSPTKHLKRLWVNAGLMLLLFQERKCLLVCFVFMLLLVPIAHASSAEDADGDGVLDGADRCPEGESAWTSNGTSDVDGDGCKDATEDWDDDGDGFEDHATQRAQTGVRWSTARLRLVTCLVALMQTLTDGRTASMLSSRNDPME